MAMAIHLPLLCLLFLTKLALSQNTEFVFQGFKGKSANLSLHGSSIFTKDGALQLTNTSPSIIGRAFYSAPVYMLNHSNSIENPVLVSSFSVTFVFAIVPGSPIGGGHGLAFVMAPSKQLQGAPSQYLGVLSAENDGNSSNHVFMVEFDTVTDSPPLGDNNVGIDINSMVSVVQEPAAYYPNETKRNETIKLESGLPIQAWIEYDGASKLVNVTISPLSVPKPRWPLLSAQLNLSDILKETMYVGFSSATGNKATSSHYILGWSFRTNGEAPALDPSRLPRPPKLNNSSPEKKVLIGIAAGVSSAVTILLLTMLVCTYFWYSKRVKQRDILEGWELECSNRFPYKHLFVATKGFKSSEILGSGGFGCVYKGVLPSTKEEVAIKKISHNSRQGIREFVAEIASLGCMRHKNLVRLHGWCKRKEDLLLVYEFMPNGSLDTFIFGDRVLNWRQRFRILKGIAFALLYLHEEWEQVVVHRDVKANNVLLDSNMEGRLGDFGLSKLYEHGQNNPSTTHVVGTLGYIAPELSRTGKATTYCDVYSYGALLLEVACGRRPVDLKATSKQILLLDWVRECWAEGHIFQAADPKLRKDYEIEEMELVLKLGLMCSQRTPEERPTMRQVIRYLDGSEIIPKDISPFYLNVDSEFLSDSAPSSLGMGVISYGSLGGGRF